MGSRVPARLPHRPLPDRQGQRQEQERSIRDRRGGPCANHPKAKNEPVETLKTATITEFLLDPLPLESDRRSLPITLTTVGQPAIDGVDGFTFDEGATPPASFEDVLAHRLEPLRRGRVAPELTIKNDSAAHHPWHPHGSRSRPFASSTTRPRRPSSSCPTTSSSTWWTSRRTPSGLLGAPGRQAFRFRHADRRRHRALGDALPHLLPRRDRYDYGARGRLVRSFVRPPLAGRRPEPRRPAGAVPEASWERDATPFNVESHPVGGRS